jgi:hypothetical protein
LATFVPKRPNVFSKISFLLATKTSQAANRTMDFVFWPLAHYNFGDDAQHAVPSARRTAAYDWPHLRFIRTYLRLYADKRIKRYKSRALKPIGQDHNALQKIYRLTKGYPYFLQEWGYQAWNHADASPISLDVIRESTNIVTRRLDENFFRVRFDRLTPRERQYLRAMAELGSGPHRTGDIADVLGAKITTLGPVRANLIKKGMVYSPSHGEMAFTVPLFDEFMRRAMPEFEPR